MQQINTSAFTFSRLAEPSGPEICSVRIPRFTFRSQHRDIRHGVSQIRRSSPILSKVLHPWEPHSLTWSEWCERANSRGLTSSASGMLERNTYYPLVGLILLPFPLLIFSSPDHDPCIGVRISRDHHRICSHTILQTFLNSLLPLCYATNLFGSILLPGHQ